MEMQRKWYGSVLERDIDAVNGTCSSFVYTLVAIADNLICRSYWEERVEGKVDEHGDAVVQSDQSSILYQWSRKNPSPAPFNLADISHRNLALLI